MPQTITMPVFGSAGQAQPTSEGTQNVGGCDWQMGESGGDADFDLLAEYLLEENPTSTAGLTFDFK
jgi:hypothetical protein